MYEHSSTDVAYDLGVAAFDADKQSTDNPYVIETPEHAAWITGFDDADDIASQEECCYGCDLPMEDCTCEEDDDNE